MACECSSIAVCSKVPRSCACVIGTNPGLHPTRSTRSCSRTLISTTAATCLHLRTPALDTGYNHQNPLRVESAIEAAAIDARIADAWSNHPRRFEVASMHDFLAKVARVIDIVRGELPECCRKHPVSELGETEGACMPR